MKIFSKFNKDNEYIKDQKNKNQKEILKNLIYAFLGVFIFIVLWELIGKLVLSIKELNQFNGFLPLPTAKALLKLFCNKSFWESVSASLIRILIGLIIASIIGIPLGLLIGFYKNLKRLTNIPIQFLRMISPLSWMPIALILLPGFEEAIYFLITISVIWPIILNTTQGVINVEPEWIKMAKNQGAKDYQLLFHVIFPASIPYILSGLRLAIGIAWIVLVPAEFLGISSGLGYLINDARDTMNYDNLIALVIAIGMLGFFIDGIFLVILKFFDWRNK